MRIPKRLRGICINWAEKKKEVIRVKPNLRCKTCGNILHFFWAKKDAKWDDKTQKWKPVFTPKSFALCGVCNSTDIEKVKGGK